MKLSFYVKGPPQPKARARKGKGGHWFTPDKTTDYETAVKGAAWAQLVMERLMQHWPRDARYAVSISMHFADRRRRDTDNVAKSILDALNGALWKDDAQVDCLTVVRGTVQSPPFTHVTVEVLSSPVAEAPTRRSSRKTARVSP
jgi:Holliday junction resolvase RusA-like endonuclease